MPPKLAWLGVQSRREPALDRATLVARYLLRLYRSCTPQSPVLLQNGAWTSSCWQSLTSFLDGSACNLTRYPSYPTPIPHPPSTSSPTQANASDSPQIVPSLETRAISRLTTGETSLRLQFNKAPVAHVRRWQLIYTTTNVADTGSIFVLSSFRSFDFSRTTSAPRRVVSFPTPLQQSAALAS